MQHIRQDHTHQSQIQIGNQAFGGQHIPVIAGPCAVESYEQMEAVAKQLVALGIHYVRGGVFKPRTSPYSFQGLQNEGLNIFEDLRKTYKLSVISEVMSVAHVEAADPYFDAFQIGSRNMQNFELLKTLGQQSKPVILKRGLSATVDEFLMAAEYIMAGGNNHVVLCERGIRSFDPALRNVLDLASVALLKERTHLPVIVDPSHATGKRSLIAATSFAAIAVGADGLMVEAHPTPDKSVSDAEQAIALEDLEQLMPKLQQVAQAVGRHILTPQTALA